MKDILKQSTAVTKTIGPVMTINGDPFTDATLASTNFWIGKADGTLANPHDTTAATLDSGLSGYYHVSLDATDTATLGELIIAARPTGGYCPNRSFGVVPAAVYNEFISAPTPTFEVECPAAIERPSC